MKTKETERRISLIIPNYNMQHTIGRCLEAAFDSDYDNFEVIVADDCSDDNSVEIIKRYPCRLIRLHERSGTSAARNSGVMNSDGEILFFIDADCLLQRDSLSAVNRAFGASGPGCVLGGTYTEQPADDLFFSRFQSATINYAETRMGDAADYIAAHAMIMSRETFDYSTGFPEDFQPIIEDVEFSHRLRRLGFRLMMVPGLEVRHIFNFNLKKSLGNAFRKSMYWTVYSMSNRDLFTDSGAASSELKVNVAANAAAYLLALACFVSGASAALVGIPALVILNAYHGRNIMKAFKRAGGASFSVMAMAYFLFLYPLPVGLGTAAGIMKYIAGFRCSAAGSSASRRRRPKDVPKIKKEVSSAIPGHLKGKEVPERLYSR